MTDADVDGAHIRTPSLILDGHRYETSSKWYVYIGATTTYGSKSVVKSKNISNLVQNQEAELAAYSFGTLFRRSLKNQPSNAIKVLEKMVYHHYGKQTMNPEHRLDGNEHCSRVSSAGAKGSR